MLATPISAQKSKKTVSSTYSRKAKFYSKATVTTKAAVTRLSVRVRKKRQVTANTFCVTHVIDFILEGSHPAVLHSHVTDLHLDLRLQVPELTFQSRDFLQHTQASTRVSTTLKSEKR